VTTTTAAHSHFAAGPRFAQAVSCCCAVNAAVACCAIVCSVNLPRTAMHEH